MLIISMCTSSIDKIARYCARWGMKGEKRMHWNDHKWDEADAVVVAAKRP